MKWKHHKIHSNLSFISLHIYWWWSSHHYYHHHYTIIPFPITSYAPFSPLSLSLSLSLSPPLQLHYRSLMSATSIASPRQCYVLFLARLLGLCLYCFISRLPCSLKQNTRFSFSPFSFFYIFFLLYPWWPTNCIVTRIMYKSRTEKRRGERRKAKCLCQHAPVSLFITISSATYPVKFNGLYCSLWGIQIQKDVVFLCKSLLPTVLCWRVPNGEN